MLKKCPNKKDPDWILMENLLGEDMAWKLYDENNQDIPTRDEIYKEYNKNEIITKATPQNITEEVLEPTSEIGKLIFERLQSKYPAVKIFTNRENFANYVRINGGNTNEIDWDTLGDAFANAVHIDPNSPVQDVLFHEYAHIYWDALSDTNPIKKSLRELYKDTGATSAEIDENIIIDIGSAGIDVASSMLPKSLIEKFNDLLQKFWVEIQKIFGKYENHSLINDMAEAIWNNLDNITEENFTSTVVHHMTKQDDLRYDDKTHVVSFGDKILQPISSAVNAVSAEPFNPDGAANKIFDRSLVQNTKKKKELIDRLNKEKYPVGGIISNEKKERLDVLIESVKRRLPENPDVRKRMVNVLKKRWEKQNSINLSMHAISDGIIKGLSKSKINDKVINKNGEKVSDLIPAETYDIIEKKITKFIDKHKKDGWKVNTDVLIGSKKHMISGHASIILTKDDKAVIIDLKPIYKNDEVDNNKKVAKYFKSPVNNIEDTQEAQWKYQVGLYANLYEDQNDVDVVETMVIPIPYDMDKGKAIVSAESTKPFTYDRKRRSSKHKDRYRDASAKILKHASLMQKIRSAKTINEDLIEKLNKKFHYDKDLLREVNIAMDVLSMHSGEELSQISEAYIENLFGIGLETMADTLIDKLGFTREDIVGNEDIDPMSAKEIIIRFRNDFKKYKSDNETKNDEWNKEPIDDFDTFKKVILRSVSPEDFKVRTAEAAFKKYKYEITIIDKIFEKIKDIHGINKLTLANIRRFHSSIIEFGSEEALNLRQFLEELQLAKMLTERIRYENQANDLYNKTATRLAYKMLVNPENLFTDFATSIGKNDNLTRTMKNIGPEHMLIQLLNQQLIGSHHQIISKTIDIREKLESFVKDNYYDSEKPKNEKKILSGKDFKAIIDTRKKGKIKYFQTAIAARNTLEKIYGKDDSRPKNMAGYIAALTSEMADYDWYVKKATAENRKTPQIAIPEKFISIVDLSSLLNGANKLYTLGLHTSLAPSSVDGRTIYINGSKITFLEYKRMIASEIIEKNNNNEPIGDLVDKAKKARNLAFAEEKKLMKKESKKILKKNIIGGKQTGKAVIVSEDYNAAIQENIASLISAKEREKLIPLGEYVKSKYKGKVVATDYLDKLVSKHIYQNMQPSKLNEKWAANLARFIFAIAAKQGLAFNIKSNLGNRFYGISGNFVMHPKTMVRSYARKIKGAAGRSGMQLARQISGMMEHARIGTVMQDFNFSKYKEKLNKLNDLAFLPLKFTEFINQGELFLGLLSDAEIAAYNKQGKPLLVDSNGVTFDSDDKPNQMTFAESKRWELRIKNATEHKDALSKERINYISTRLNEVHGYFGFDKPAWSYYELGQWIGLYRLSWMQSIFNMWYMSRRSDITGVERVGITRSYALVVKSLMYNWLKSFRNKAISKVQASIESGSYFFDENRGKAFEEARKKLISENRFAEAKEGVDIIYEGENNGKHKYRIDGLNYDFSAFDSIVQKKMEEDAKKEGVDHKISFKGENRDVGRVDLNNLVRGVILAGTYWLTYAFIQMIGDWDDDIIFGEEQKINGRKIRSTDRRRALYELTKNERLKHYLYQSITGMGENITGDLSLPMNVPGLLALAKDPLVPLRYVKKWYDFFTEMGQRYETPTTKNKYGAWKGWQNTIDLTMFSNLHKQLNIAARVLSDDPYYESLEKMWDDNRAGLLKNQLAKTHYNAKRNNKSQKEINEEVKKTKEKLNKYFENPKYKEQFVRKILIGVHRKQQQFDSKDKQIKLMIDMMNEYSATESYYKEEIKDNESKLKRSDIKKSQKNLDKLFDNK